MLRNYGEGAAIHAASAAPLQYPQAAQRPGISSTRARDHPVTRGWSALRYTRAPGRSPL